MSDSTSGSKARKAGSSDLAIVPPPPPEGDASQAAEPALTPDDLALLNSGAGLRKLLKSKHIKVGKILAALRYEQELEGLQVELVKLQRSVQEEGRRVAIIFEGRDAAGKGGAILRFTQHLSPRAMRVVALAKPTPVEKGEWYFQRYTRHLPDPGQMVFFDRSWYNRAVVEPVNGFCTEEQYQTFMRQVPEFEHMLFEDGIEMIKFWFSITKKTQQKRFRSRRRNPLKNWKVSPVDERAQDLWDSYTHYKDEMFSRTHTSYSPWIIVGTNDKHKARLEGIRYVLSRLPYEGKSDAKVDLYPDPNVVSRFHRGSI
ncbi:MAG: polyphosphate kinase 2 [Acidobacteria bacterium]|nr:polyphosphate kinase 2 [Acidobacteriota bacterium]